MGKGIGLLANSGYVYKLLTDPGTLLTPGVLDMQGFKGDPGADVQILTNAVETKVADEAKKTRNTVLAN